MIYLRYNFDILCWSGSDVRIARLMVYQKVVNAGGRQSRFHVGMALNIAPLGGDPEQSSVTK